MQVPEDLFWIHKIDNFIMCLDRLSDDGQSYQFTVTIIAEHYTNSRYQICHLSRELVENESEEMVVGALNDLMVDVINCLIDAGDIAE